MELTQLSPEEAELFREDMGLEEPATLCLIRESYHLQVTRAMRNSTASSVP